MYWIEKTNEEDLLRKEDDPGQETFYNRKIVKLPPVVSDQQMTVLSQFFLALSAINGKNNVVQIPLTTERVQQEALAQISCFLVKQNQFC